MKKIAFIHPNIFPGGGAERVTLDIARFLQQHAPAEFRCYVFAPKIVEELCSPELQSLVELREIRSKMSDRCADVERLIIKEGIRLIVQVVIPLPGIKGICERTGCKSIWANHGEPFWQRHAIIERRRKMPLNWLFWHIFVRRMYEDKGKARDIAIKRTLEHYNECDAYTVLCDEYKEETCKALGIRLEDSKIHVIENAERVVEDVTYEKENIIMYCGRLANGEKRVDRLLRIWQKVQHRLPDYTLLIVGDGPDRRALEQMTSKRKLQRVEMVGAQSDVEQYYRRASIVCLTSQTEGWGLCLTEAQANGCIPIAFGCSAGVKNILSPSGINGFIITPFNEEEYADVLVKVALMPEPEKNVIRHNVVIKRAEYTPDIILKKWQHLFDSLL